VKRICAILIISLACCAQSYACTPVATLAYLLLGSSSYGMLIGGKFGNAYFAIAFLVLAIIFKSALYAKFCGYPKRQAAFDMFIANIFSTIIGFIIGISVASTSLTLFAIIFAGMVLAVFASRAFSKGVDSVKPWVVTLLTCFGLLASFIFLMVAESFDPSDVMENKYAALSFFAVKAVGIFFALVATLGISAVFEGAYIFSRHKRQADFNRKQSLQAILKANVYMFLAISIIGLAVALPMRWDSPNFIWIPDDRR